MLLKMLGVSCYANLLLLVVGGDFTKNKCVDQEFQVSNLHTCSRSATQKVLPETIRQTIFLEGVQIFSGWPLSQRLKIKTISNFESCPRNRKGGIL